MPFYEYQCKNCGHDLEAMQKINDPPLKKCPHCGKSQLQRLMSAPVFRLKGAGWYETDFKGDGDNKKNLADKPEPITAKDAAKDTAKDSAKESGKDTGKDSTKDSDGKGKDAKAGDSKDSAKPAEKSADKPAGKAASTDSGKKSAPAKPSRRGAGSPARSGAKRPVKRPVAKAKVRR
jgi:putative FmdB family regulatory protein